MASFEEHITQAKRNLTFLTETNSKMQTYWDWQVTTAFYVAVHLVNAHLAKAANIHYKTHEAVKNEINPLSLSSNPACMVDQNAYLAYTKLEGLSRRSRYLCHQDKNVTTEDDIAHTTSEKHFAKAIKNLDKLLLYFMAKYSITIDPPPTVICTELQKQSLLSVFKIP